MSRNQSTEPADRDRLFAVPILKYRGSHIAFWPTLRLDEMPREQRHAFLQDCQEQAPDEDTRRFVDHSLAAAVYEVDAAEVIERVRWTSLVCQPTKPRGRSTLRPRTRLGSLKGESK